MIFLWQRPSSPGHKPIVLCFRSSPNNQNSLIRSPRDKVNLQSRVYQQARAMSKGLRVLARA